MTDIQKLTVPQSPEDPSILSQLTSLFETAAQGAGCYVFEHPEEHCFNAVFGGHQVIVSVKERK